MIDNTQAIVFDKNKNNVLLTENSIYTEAKIVSSDHTYTLSGKVLFDSAETEKKILLLVKFENIIMTKELCIKCNLSFSERYGAYKYITKNSFSFSFVVPENAKKVTLGIRKWQNKKDVYILSELLLVKKVMLSICTFGSCLSDLSVTRMISRFGGGRNLFHVNRTRSDQFFHYHVKKDRQIIPRTYIDNNLKSKHESSDDPNYISPEEMLNSQYGTKGKQSIDALFQVLHNEQLDIIVLDNYVDMGAAVSYPKKEGYENSPIFLRKFDYSNYDDFFRFGKKLTNTESSYYFKEIIHHFRTLQPNAIIYFLHYPYNTYVDNPKRQIRAMEFEDIFQSKLDGVVIVPAFHIAKTFQIEDDPSHFDDSIYVAYGGFIYADFVRKKRQLVSHPRMPSYTHMYNRKYHSEYLVLTNNYPSYDHYYQNAFIHTRVRAYIENGLHPDVYKMTLEDNLEQHRFEEVHVTTGSGKTFDDLLAFHPYKHILVHFLNEMMWNHLKKYIDHTKVLVWVHGYEIQPWHRRSFNYNNEEEITKAKVLSEKRISFWKKILKDPHPNLKLVFVSQYFADEVMKDLGIVLPKSTYEIIHNYINTDLFKYEKKPEDQRRKILSIRPYASNKYANDLSVEAVLYIKEKYSEIFTDLEFTFIGDGVLFDRTLEPLKVLANVKIEKRFLKQSDIAKLHKEYGLFLSPTRMDSQGVSRDEAMSSGLVPITNNVTAVPEFVDETCGILAEEDDYKGLAEGIVNLYKNPNLFLEMSENAAQRVRRQSGYEQTIVKELAIIKNFK